VWCVDVACIRRTYAVEENLAEVLGIGQLAKLQGAAHLIARLFDLLDVTEYVFDLPLHETFIGVHDGLQRVHVDLRERCAL
jgi:hypothetical protein